VALSLMALAIMIAALTLTRGSPRPQPVA
jgi:hypothetical protein